MNTANAIPATKRRRRRRLLLAVVIVLIGAAGWWHRFVQAAYARLAYDFQRLDGRSMCVQAGQEERARAVAEFMDDSVQTVEKVVQTKLARPAVFCLRSENEYSTYTAAPGSRGSCTVLGEVCCRRRSRTTPRSSAASSFTR